MDAKHLKVFLIFALGALVGASFPLGRTDADDRPTEPVNRGRRYELVTHSKLLNKRWMLDTYTGKTWQLVKSNAGTSQENEQWEQMMGGPVPFDFAELERVLSEQENLRK